MDRWGRHCSMIIYNVGGASVADHKHLKRIKGLRARAAEAPLVILSDNDSREEILSALSAGAQGFLYAGTNAQLALQALSFIFKGGSYFPAAPQPRRRNPVHLNGAMECSSPPTECTTLDVGNGIVENTADAEFDEHQSHGKTKIGTRTSRPRRLEQGYCAPPGNQRGNGQGSRSTDHAQARRGQPYAGRHCLRERRPSRNARGRSQHQGQDRRWCRAIRSSAYRWRTARPERPSACRCSSAATRIRMAWICRRSFAPSPG